MKTREIIYPKYYEHYRFCCWNKVSVTEFTATILWAEKNLPQKNCERNRIYRQNFVSVTEFIAKILWAQQNLTPKFCERTRIHHHNYVSNTISTKHNPFISELLKISESPVRADRSVSSSEHDSCSRESSNECTRDQNMRKDIKNTKKAY